MSGAYEAARNVVLQTSKFVGEDVDVQSAVEDETDIDDVAELAELHLDAARWAEAFRLVARWAKNRAGLLLGAEKAYRYGDTVFVGGASGKWVPKSTSGLVDFALAGGEAEDVLTIFKTGDPKITGVKAVAKKRGLDPNDTAKDLLFWKPDGTTGKTATPASKGAWRVWYPTGDNQYTTKDGT